MPAQAAARVQQLVNEIASTHLRDAPALPAKLQELQAALAEVQTFAGSMQQLLGAPQTPRRGRSPKMTSRPGAPRRRGPGRAKGGVGEFASTAFITNAVKKAGVEGLRPRDIVRQIQEVAPGHHRKPSATVSTTLTRLKKQGVVRRSRGKWYPVVA